MQLHKCPKQFCPPLYLVEQVQFFAYFRRTEAKAERTLSGKK